MCWRKYSLPEWVDLISHWKGVLSNSPFRYWVAAGVGAKPPSLQMKYRIALQRLHCPFAMLLTNKWTSIQFALQLLLLNAKMTSLKSSSRARSLLQSVFRQFSNNSSDHFLYEAGKGAVWLQNLTFLVISMKNWDRAEHNWENEKYFRKYCIWKVKELICINKLFTQKSSGTIYLKTVTTLDYDLTGSIDEPTFSWLHCFLFLSFICLCKLYHIIVKKTLYILLNSSSVKMCWKWKLQQKNWKIAALYKQLQI